MPYDVSTEFIVRDFLLQNPNFFKQHSDIICQLNFPRQNKDGTKSVLECQIEALKEELALYESQETGRPETDSAELTCADRDSLLAFSLDLLRAGDEAKLPLIVLDHFKSMFGAEHGMIRLWDLSPNFSFLAYSESVGSDLQMAISSMPGPYCGKNEGDAVANWLRVSPDQTRSVVLAPLRDANQLVFGFICLAHGDPQHFDRAAANGFVLSAAEFAQAALKRLKRS
jgi:hypothetical protein